MNKLTGVIESRKNIQGNVDSKLEIIANIMGTGKSGKSLEFDWDGTRLGVRVEGEIEYEYVDLQANSYIHDQILAKKEWIIDHNLSRYPSVFVVDSSGNVVIGELKYISENRLTLYFTSSFSGRAYLN